MEEFKNILSVIDYTVNEKLFFLFWGSQSDWQELLDGEYLIPADEEEEYIVNSEKRINLQLENAKVIHKAAYTKYIKYLEREHEINLENIELLSKILHYTSKHSIGCDLHDDLVKRICQYYKWLVYWNIDREWVWDYFGEVGDFLTPNQKGWVTYLGIFEETMPRITEDPKKLETELYDLLNQEEPTLHVQIYNLLGILALSNNDLTIAKDMFAKCKNLSLELGDTEIIGTSLLNLSIILHKENPHNWQHILNEISDVEKLFRKIGSQYYYYLAHYNFLVILFENDEKGLGESFSLDNILKIGIKYPNLGRLYLNLKCKETIRRRDLENYFLAKSFSIMISFQLYNEDYMEEFFTLLNQIEESVTQFRDSLANELHRIIGLYERLHMKNEERFFKGIVMLLEDPEFNPSVYVENIDNPFLHELFISECGRLEKRSREAF